MTPDQLEETWKIRNNMTGDALEYTEQFRQLLTKTKNNQELFDAFSEVTFGRKNHRNQKR